jgi:hypothetical protein
MRCVWIGPVIRSVFIGGDNVISPAANTWQEGFIDSIATVSDVLILSYVPKRSWPKGPLISRDKYNYFGAKRLRYSLLGCYLNIRYVRELQIGIWLFYKLLRGDYDVVVTYNYTFAHRVGLYIRTIRSFKWIQIIADRGDAGKADLNVYLSYDFFIRSRKMHKICFPGGITRREFPQGGRNPKKVLLYAGSYTKWTGVLDVVGWFLAKVIDDGWELHLYGRASQDVIDKIKGCERIRFHGLVDNDTLETACQCADAFIDPRPIQVEEGDNNFPSKLLYYLGFKRPILSTKVRTIHPDIKSFLIGYDPTSVQSLNEALRALSKWSLNEAAYEVLLDQFSWKNGVRDILGIRNDI